MASVGGEQQISSNSPAGDTTERDDSREGSAERKVIKDRDEKLKLARERQNEEKQRKIEELKAQAEAAQRYREQTEEKRRRRIEEIRHRDSEKRHQVEERKRAIMEADKERREYILKKNQERDSKLDVKRRERSLTGFAFGSSTPRNLELSDFALVSSSTFLGQRRSTSISNVAGASLSRRSSERELVESGSKKRATSASGTDRHDEDNVDTSQFVFRSVARRKTDLMPTIPSPRDGYHYGSKSSLSNTPRTPGRAFSMNRLDQLAQPIRRNGEHIRAILERERREQMELLDETESVGGGRRSGKRSKKPDSAAMSRSMTHLASHSSSSQTRAKYSLGGGISSSFRPLGGGGSGGRDACSRSGNVTPGGSMNASRPGSAMSTSTNLSTSGYVARRSVPAARKPRPASIAGTVVSLDELNKLKKDKPPMKTSTLTASAQTTPKRPSNIMSTSMIVTSSSRLSSAEKKPTTPKRDTSNSKSSTPKSLSKTSSFDRLNKITKETKSVNVSSTLSIAKDNGSLADTEKTNASTPAKSKEEKNALNSIKTEETSVLEQQVAITQLEVSKEQAPIAKLSEEKVDQGSEKNVPLEPEVKNSSKASSEVRELTPQAQTQADGNDLMSSSMIAKGKITTEEEAKAALAERRRLAREEAERQAELERQRIEAERLAELQRQEEEAERQRQFEEESMRLAVEQRKAEEERLRQAIEEAKQREEEDCRKREEEERQRVEREEADKKAKEEAEKQRIEVAERLKREEKEREERRKRVEAIMLRTRKGGAANTPNSTPVKENNETNKTTNDVQAAAPETTTATEAPANQSQQLISTSSESGSTSGSTTTATTPTPATVQAPVAVAETQNSQAMYEQSVLDKENALIQSFSNMIIDENAKNLQQLQQPAQILDVINGKLHSDLPNNDTILQNSTTTITTTTTTAVANGNGHIENINNKNDINLLQDVVAPATNQLIDLSIEAQDINDAVNFNNNNSLMTTTTNTLVTADSHENKDISLL